MKIKSVLIGFASFLATGVFAQTVATTATEGAAVRDTSIVKNQSKYASQSDRSFTVVRVYDFDVHGGAAAAISLDKNNEYKDLPDNSIITEAVIDIIEAVDADVNVDISVGGVEIYNTNTLDDAAAVLFPTVAAKTTSEGDFVVTPAGALTTGYFTVTISGYQGQ